MPIVRIPVAASNDNAVEKDDGTGFMAGSTNAAVFADASASVRSNIGLRFVTNIPAFATIKSAHLECLIPGSKTPLDDPTLKIYPDLANNANSSDFVASADVTTRVALMVAGSAPNVAWSATDLGSGLYVNSPDITTLLNRILTTTGKNDTGELVLLLAGDTAASGDLQIGMFDSGTPPILVVEYELLPIKVCATQAAGSGNLSVDWDAGGLADSKVGDLLVCTSGMGSQTAALTAPSDNGTWTEVPASPQTTNSHEAAQHYRFRAASEASETWVRSTGDLAQMYEVFRFVDPTNPVFGADGVNGVAATATAIFSPELLDARVGDLDHRSWILDDRATVTWTEPAGYTKLIEGVVSTRCQMLSAGKTVTVAGTQASQDATSSAADQWASFTLGLRKIQRRPHTIIF